MASPLRIALDTQSTLGRKTGIGIYTSELLAAMRRVAPEHEYVELNWGNDVSMRLDRRLRWQQYEIPRRSRDIHADLLHVPGFDAPVRRSIPTILTVHDLIGMLFPQNLPPVSRFYWSRWLPFTVRYADAIIADSAATRNDIVHLLHADPQRITVIPLGVSELFRPAATTMIADMRNRYHLINPYILFVGTLEPRKGIDTLIDAVARLIQGYPHELVLVGKKGWYWDRLQSRIANNGLEGRVRVLDYVPTNDLPAIYSGADVFAFPSRYEGFGLPILEAMACYTPVVCANASSLPEVAGTAAILIKPDDVEVLTSALLKVINTPECASAMRDQGILQASLFSWDQTARMTLDLYQKTVTTPL